MKKQRLDKELVRQGFFSSEKEALPIIMAGKITVNGHAVTTAGAMVLKTDIIELVKDTCPYVSRGGLKLEHALKEFNINVKGKICLDAGVSTGGFSDCFLQHGAQLVYGVDVGKGQLNEKILANPNFKFYPQTNARTLNDTFFNPKPAVAAIDVSFISLKLVLEPVINSMAPSCQLAVLIKPQFELPPKQAPGGIVLNETYRANAVEALISFSQNELKHLKLNSVKVIPSPIKGTKGNAEFLWHIIKTN